MRVLTHTLTHALLCVTVQLQALVGILMLLQGHTDAPARVHTHTRTHAHTPHTHT